MGKQHLTNITREFEHESLLTHKLNPEEEKSTEDLDQSSPISIEEYTQRFKNLAQSQILEIDELKKNLEQVHEEKIALLNEICVMKETETKLGEDLATLHTYGTSLQSQLDALRMVPTLFGVINF